MVQAVQRLYQAWRERIHPAASREQVAVALALAAGGAVLALLGVLFVALGDFVLPRPSWLREVGFVAAAAGLPVFLLGIIVALPTRRWMAALAAMGAASVSVGVFLFALWYPDQWYLTVREPNVYAIGAYMFGVSTLAAVAAAELASYFVERARGPAGEGAERREVTDEEIWDDLAWADKQGWSWGGIRQGGPKATVKLKDDMEEVSFKGRGKRFLAEKETSEGPVKAAAALRGLRGQKEPTSDSRVDDQVAFLKELKQKKAQEEAAKRDSFWWRLTHPGSWFH